MRLPGSKKSLTVRNPEEALMAMTAMAEMNLAGSSMLADQHEREVAELDAKIVELQALLARQGEQAAQQAERANKQAALAQRYRSGEHLRPRKQKEAKALQQAARQVTAFHNVGASKKRDAALKALPGAGNTPHAGRAKNVASELARVMFEKGQGSAATTTEGLLKFLRRSDTRWLLPAHVRDSLDEGVQSAHSAVMENAKALLAKLKAKKGGTLRTEQHNAREVQLALLVPADAAKRRIMRPLSRALGCHHSAIKRGAATNKRVNEAGMWEAIERAEYSNTLPREAKWLIWNWWCEPDCPSSRINNSDKRKVRVYNPDEISRLDKGERPSKPKRRFPMLQVGTDGDALEEFKKTAAYSTLVEMTTSKTSPDGIELCVDLFVHYRPAHIRKLGRHSKTGHCACPTCTDARVAVEIWGRCRGAWFAAAEKSAARCVFNASEGGSGGKEEHADMPGVEASHEGECEGSMPRGDNLGISICDAEFSDNDDDEWTMASDASEEQEEEDDVELEPECGLQPEACDACGGACRRGSEYRQLHRGGLSSVIKACYCRPKPCPALDLPGGKPFAVRDLECSRGDCGECGAAIRFAATKNCNVERDTSKFVYTREFQDVPRGKNKNGDDVFQRELVPIRLSRDDFMDHLVAKLEKFESHIAAVRLQSQTERLWEQHKQADQATVIADFGAALSHPREFTATCAFEEKSTHSIICVAHTPHFVAVNQDEQSTEGEDEQNRRAFRPAASFSHREAVKVLNPATLGSVGRWLQNSSSGAAQKLAAKLSAAAATMGSFVDGYFQEQQLRQAAELAAASPFEEEARGVAGLQLTEEESKMFAGLGVATAQASRRLKELSSSQQHGRQRGLCTQTATRAATAAGVWMTAVRAMECSIRAAAVRLATAGLSADAVKSTHPATTSAKPRPKLVRVQKVDAWFMLTKCKNDATTFVHHLRDVFSFYKTGKVKHGEWFQGGMRLPGGDHEKQLPRNMGLREHPSEAAAGGEQKERNENAHITPDAPHIKQATIITDGCRKQYDCARWLNQLANGFNEFDLELRHVKHPPNHGKHCADGASNVPKNRIWKQKLRARRSAETGSRGLVLHLASTDEGPDSEGVAWWNFSRYFFGHLAEGQLDAKSVPNAHTIKDNTKFLERTVVKGKGQLILRGLHCECPPCRSGDWTLAGMAKCKCTELMGMPELRTPVTKAEEVAGSAGFTRGARRRRERDEEQDTALCSLFGELSETQPHMVALRGGRELEGKEEYWLAKPVSKAYELEKARESGNKKGNNLAAGYWVIDVKYFKLQRTGEDGHHYNWDPKHKKKMTITITSIIPLLTLKVPTRKARAKTWVLPLAVHRQIQAALAAAS